MSATQMFILQEIGWEYNDETYSRPSDGVGAPRTAYSTRKAADQACAELNRTKWEETKEDPMIDWNDREIKEFFEIVEVIKGD